MKYFKLNFGVASALVLIGGYAFITPTIAQELSSEVLNTVDLYVPEEGASKTPAVNDIQTGDNLRLVPEPSDVGNTPSVNELSDPAPQVSQIQSLSVQPSTAPIANDENLFFDANALVPKSELSRKSGAKKVNPKLQPGSRFVVVEKDYSAGSKQSSLVAAQRAVKLGRYESALEIYDTLYARNKKDPAVLLGRAVVYQKLNQDDYAVQAYEELLDIRPNDVEANINMLGIIAKKYPEAAIRQLRDLRKKNYNNVGVIAQLAIVEGNLGNYEEAIRSLGVAASMEPHNASHVFNMAVIADMAGSRSEAVQFYEDALEIDTLYGKGMSIPRDSVFERLAELR